MADHGLLVLTQTAMQKVSHSCGITAFFQLNRLVRKFLRFFSDFRFLNEFDMVFLRVFAQEGPIVDSMHQKRPPNQSPLACLNKHSMPLAWHAGSFCALPTRSYHN